MSATSPSKNRPPRLPLVAVRDVVVSPHMMLPLSVGRAKSIKALEAAMKGSDKLLAVVAQKDVQLEDPQAGDLFGTGVLVEVAQFLKMPDGTLKVFLQGLRRAHAGFLAPRPGAAFRAHARARARERGSRPRPVGEPREGRDRPLSARA